MLKIANEVPGRPVPNTFGLEVMHLSEFPDTDLQEFESCDALILDGARQSDCLNFLQRLRSSGLVALYLKPVFVISVSAVDQESILPLADGLLHSADIDLIAPVVQQINRRVRQVISGRLPGSGNPVLEKLLAYLFTRDSALAPVIDPASPHGFTFPLLLNRENSSQGRDQIEAIEQGLDLGYLARDFGDRLHLCPDCYHGFLNFRETCHTCNSANLTPEDVIHHFVCAYIGPESDFFQNGELQCPKCDRFLKHIGVDYDKPSQIFVCNNCQSAFQEPEMKVFCFHCRRETDPAHLKEFDVGKLHLTEKGRTATVQGIQERKASATTVPHGLVSFDLFERFLQHEIDREQIAPAPCTAGVLQFRFSAEAETRLHADLPKIMEEIAGMVWVNLKQPNIVCLLAENRAILLLLPNVSQETAATVLEDFQREIQKLLRHNVPAEGTQLFTEVLAIGPETTREEVLEKLLGLQRGK